MPVSFNFGFIRCVIVVLGDDGDVAALETTTKPLQAANTSKITLFRLAIFVLGCDQSLTLLVSALAKGDQEAILIGIIVVMVCQV